MLVRVDEHDQEIGVVEKMSAHREGVLHRAFSVFVFDRSGRLLLQRRALDKYHSGGLWSNTCCSHPGPGERPIDAAHRRLEEEMGFDCPLTGGYAFTYRVDVGNGLVEHEFDHVFVGQCQSVQPVGEAIGKTCHYLPPAVDVLRFAPARNAAPRWFDGFSVGRRM